MTYGYIRVSTDKQTVENQRFEIKRFCKGKNMKVDKWHEETISGAKDPAKRKFGKLLAGLQKGDVLICTELSRLGRGIVMVLNILNECLTREVQVWTIRDNYRLGTDISSKVIAFAFALTAEIERNLVSQRTKEALMRKRAEGVVLGRPFGRKNTRVKLTGREDEILLLLKRGHSQTRIARRLKVHRLTLGKFLRDTPAFTAPANPE